MPTFKDATAPVLLPEADCIFCVVQFDIGISTGAKTKGSENYEMKVEIEPTGKILKETLIDHPSTDWKIDCFLKSAGVQIAKGETFDFNETVATGSNVRWIDPIGLRGWCRIIQETLTGRNPEEVAAIKAGSRKATVVNKISVFYTDRPKLPARVIEKEEEPF